MGTRARESAERARPGWRSGSGSRADQDPPRWTGALPWAVVPLVLFFFAGGILPGLGTPGIAAQSPSGSDSGEDPNPLLEQASQRYAGLEGFCAEFAQERVVPLLDRTTRSRGTLCQMRPGFFLMEFSEPDGDRVVADGESLWIYYPSVDPEQVIRTRLGGAGGTFDFHAEFLEDPTRRFDAEYVGREEVTGRSTHVIALRPLESVAYEEATVWLEVERGLIRKVEIVEENESLRRMTLSDIRVEPGLNPSRFAFEPPEDAQVLDRNLPSPPR